jgi:hypothetical protein
MTEVAPPPAVVVRRREPSATAWAKRRAPSIVYVIIGAIPGAVAGLLLALIWLDNDAIGLTLVAIGASLTAGYTAYHAWALVCTQCGASLPRHPSICPACHATILGRVTETEMNEMASKEWDERVAKEMNYEECPDCKPEEPCEAHALEEMALEDFDELAD